MAWTTPCCAAALVMVMVMAAASPAAAQTAEAPVASGHDALDTQIAAYLNHAQDAAPVKTAPAGLASDAPPAPDRKVHGVMSVGIGTGGYREVSGAMVAPLGQTGTVAIAVGQTQGRGFWGPADLGLAPPLPSDLAVADGVRPPACPSIRDRPGLEPLWVGRVKAAAPAATAADCP